MSIPLDLPVVMFVRYWLQATSVQRAWFQRGPQVHHCHVRPQHHCRLQHQAAVLRQGIPQGKSAHFSFSVNDKWESRPCSVHADSQWPILSWSTSNWVNEVWRNTTSSHTSLTFCLWVRSDCYKCIGVSIVCPDNSAPSLYCVAIRLES